MWSQTKKKLESLTCAVLKDRVKFFVTNYTDAHDQYGRACFVVDGREMYNMCFYKYQVSVGRIEVDLLADPNYHAKYDSKYSAGYEAREIAASERIYADWDFFEAIDAFIHNSIKDSLQSENEIIMSLALIDRRTGKRTLQK